MMTDRIDNFHQDIKKRSHCLRNCTLFLVSFSLLSSLGIGLLVARTGLATVPVLSAWNYQLPKPWTEVTVPAGQTEDLQRRLQEQTDGRTVPDVTMTLTEADLNAVIRTKFPDTTITLGNGTLEWFSPLVLKKISLRLAVEVVPYAENGRLRIQVTRSKIGQLDIPAGLLTWVGRVIQKRLIDSNQLIKQIRFDEISVTEDGFLLRGNVPLNFGGPAETEEVY